VENSSRSVGSKSVPLNAPQLWRPLPAPSVGRRAFKICATRFLRKIRMHGWFQSFFRKRIALLVASVFVTLTGAQGQVASYPLDDQTNFTQDTWHISVTPYVWLAGLDGTVGLSGHVADVHQSFGDILGNLKVGFMGLGEVRRGRFGLLTDILYLRVGDQTAVPVTGLPSAVPIKATANTFTLQPSFAYRAYAKHRVAIDATAGVRYWHLDAKVATQTGTPERCRILRFE
jgi:hypothetical protein